MIRYVFSDLDGTLCLDNKTISRENRHAVMELREKGIGFSLATGRAYPAAKHFLSFLGLDTPVICLNGALVVNPVGDEIIAHSPIPKESLGRLIEKLKEHDMYFHFYSKDGVYGEKMEGALAFYEEHNKSAEPDARVNVHLMDNALDILSMDIAIYKLGFYTKDDEFHRSLTADMAKDPEIVSYKSLSNLQDFMAKGVDKSIGVDAVSKLYGVTRDEIMCIGDNENDVKMIEMAGLGLAMATATDDIKRIADIVLGAADDEAVAYAIRAYALGTCTL